MERGFAAIFLAITTLAGAAAPGPLVVSQDGSGSFRGKDEKPILAAIAEAVRQGGGEIIIQPGVYLVHKGIVIENAQHIALRGVDAESVVLKLPPLTFAESAAAAPAGATELRLRRMQNLRPGMRLHLDADGPLDGFTKKPRPYILATIRAITGDRATLDAPLTHPVPEGTTMRDEDAPNLIEVRAGSKDILIEKLTLDGGRTENDPPVRGHAQLCGIFASGAYTYEKGPAGPQVEDIMISRCIIQNCFGRGVAFYSVKQGFVLNTTIMDTHDEAVDFDHFTVKCAMQGCHVARCHVGVELNDANDCLVQNNDFRGCTTGLNLWRWCKQEDLNRRNAIRGNLFQDTEQTAIQLAAGTAENLVEENLIAGAGRSGIVINGDSQRVLRNTIRGVKLKALVVSGGKHTVDGNRAE